jgi:hypothetical protein
MFQASIEVEVVEYTGVVTEVVIAVAAPGTALIVLVAGECSVATGSGRTGLTVELQRAGTRVLTQALSTARRLARIVLLGSPVLRALSWATIAPRSGLLLLCIICHFACLNYKAVDNEHACCSLNL